MPAPESYAEVNLDDYSLLDFVGYTDKGGYDETATYMENDIVHFANIAWRCLIDDTTGIEPAEGDNWEIFVEGEKYYKGTYATFPRPPLPEDLDKFFVDIETDPRLMYTWDEEKEDYILTGGAGGADGSSMDITITLLADAWTGDTAPYTQTVTVPQMREGMTPYFFLAFGGDDERYAESLLTGYTTSYAEITFQAADLPSADMEITLKGIPAQEVEYVDNTVVLVVEPSSFELSTDPDYDGRYVSTIAVEGMSAGAEGGSWDIVRSGAVLSLEESKIAAHITDVNPMDGAVQIVCTEIPGQTYLLKLTGTFAEATPGDVILPNIQPWLDKVEELEKANEFSFDEVRIGTWVDGKPLYRKMVDFGVLPANDIKRVAHNVENCEHIHVNLAESMWVNKNVDLSSDETIYTFVYNAFGFSLACGRDDVIIITTNSNASEYKVYVCIEYTKTTD